MLQAEMERKAMWACKGHPGILQLLSVENLGWTIGMELELPRGGSVSLSMFFNLKISKRHFCGDLPVYQIIELISLIKVGEKKREKTKR